MCSLRSRAWAGVIALALLGSVALRPAAARADGSDQPPGPTEHVVKIGPQATVIVNQHGDARMYDDPSQDAPVCKKNRNCMNSALGIFSFFILATYLELTDGVETGSGRLQRFQLED
jgi:hypothetical protein